MKQIHSTTILCVRRDGHVALGGDGQVTIGDTVMKANANKVRALKGGKILAGFAGAAAASVRAPLTSSGLPAKDSVRRTLEIAAEICVYTNTHITILEL